MALGKLLKSTPGNIRMAIIVSLSFLVFLTSLAACGGDEVENRAPTVVSGIILPNHLVEAGETVTVILGAFQDPDGDPLVFRWQTERGKINPSGPTKNPSVEYTAPNQAGPDRLTVLLDDGKGGVSTASLSFVVVVKEGETGNGQVDPDVPQEFRVTIDQPRPGQRVQQSTGVLGTASQPVPESKFLWVVVKVDSSFWPQVSRVVPYPGSTGVTREWTVNVGLGGEGDNGKGFEILAVLTSSAVDKEFFEWLEAGSLTGNWPGFPSARLDGNSVKIEAGVAVIRE